MGRFKNAPVEVIDMANNIISQRFPELANAKIVYLFDSKKNSSGGRITFAKIQKSTDLIRHLTKDIVEDTEGTDYIVVIDELLWSVMEENDKIRVIRHELRHTTYDVNAKTPYGLRDHTVQDFHEEIELNTDDPRWAQRLALELDNEYVIRENTIRHNGQQQAELFDDAA